MTLGSTLLILKLIFASSLPIIRVEDDIGNTLAAKILMVAINIELKVVDDVSLSNLPVS